ncbi:hypothetical protein Q5M85_14625 [Paraclostridium bifermentans]|nr:hypothetical protein [Paraclostridium bifermentans]
MMDALLIYSEKIETISKFLEKDINIHNYIESKYKIGIKNSIKYIKSILIRIDNSNRNMSIFNLKEEVEHILDKSKILNIPVMVDLKEIESHSEEIDILTEKYKHNFYIQKEIKSKR